MKFLYQYLKTQPDGTRCKKVIQDFNSTVIMLSKDHILYIIYIDHIIYSPYDI